MSAAKAKGAVGIVGLGIMGGAFAKNLVAAGWRVVGYDTNPARRREARRAGGYAAANATIAIIASPAPKTRTSVAPTPNRIDETARPTA